MGHHLRDGVEIIAREELLVALFSPMSGPWSPTHSARLKLARGVERIVSRSIVEHLGEAGTVLGGHSDAFGLSKGMRLTGPMSVSLVDERLRPAGTRALRWRFDDWTLDAFLEPASPVRVAFLPMHVPLADDRHVLVTLTNLGDTLLDVVTPIFEALLWVDGRPYPTRKSFVWNTRRAIHPGRRFRMPYRLDDFVGAPRLGTHEVSLEILGRRTEPQTLEWYGEPWVEPAPR
jgi:hypothetical protein